MERKSVCEYAGNLELELKEFKNISADKERIESKYTTTAKCGTFLTLICC